MKYLKKIRNPSLRNLFTQFNNLPAQLTSLIGREQEVAAVCTLLRREDVHLVTLTGTGGIGKTRLGLAVATELLDSFADGVCFVPLASISDPALVVPAIARLLGLEQTHTGSRSAQLDMEYLKAFLLEKQFLLVLDNFEQQDDQRESGCGHRLCHTPRSGLVARSPFPNFLLTSSQHGQFFAYVTFLLFHKPQQIRRFFRCSREPPAGTLPAVIPNLLEEGNGVAAAFMTPAGHTRPVIQAS